MLSKYVGEDKFLKGVSLYLKKHLYSNTVSDDLWEGIGEATGTHVRNLRRFCANEGCTEGLDIPKIMKSWVSQVRGRAYLAYVMNHQNPSHRWDSR
jgi:aminopeptidase N